MLDQTLLDQSRGKRVGSQLNGGFLAASVSAVRNKGTARKPWLRVGVSE
jgi:hypothetical protein